MCYWLWEKKGSGQGFCCLTSDAKFLPGAVIQTPVKVEKARVLLDANPVVFMQPCAVDAVEVLAKAEAGDFLRGITQGVDIEQGHSGWLVQVQLLPVSVPGEVESQRGCREQGIG